MLAGLTWFEDGGRMGAVFIAGVMAYAALVVVLRVSGKRTLAKLNAFDFVVTIALGSVLATVVVSRDIPLAEGLAALGLLVGLQVLVAKVSQRFSAARRVITSEPTALLVRGELRHEELTRSRVAPQEVAAAVRQQGLGSLCEVDYVVLESDGSLSVVADAGDGTAMIGVVNLEDEDRCTSG